MREQHTISVNIKKALFYELTYIHTRKNGWCYLASVMDLHSKKIIGYSFSKTMDANIPISAVKNALTIQHLTKQLVLHSDLGSQYTSLLSIPSVLKVSLRNACIESFHASLKKEEVNLANYYDFHAARLAIFEYIESWYSRKRVHSSIGYITPQQCEDKSRQAA